MSEKIVVLMGGRSLERDVSLASGKRVFDALSASGYHAVPLDVTSDLVQRLRSERPDGAYIALHGKYGEDGTIQQLLEFLSIPYTGPNIVTCTLAWDKSVAKQLLTDHGITTPSWITLTADAFKEMGAATALSLVGDAVGGYPVAVKPSRQGSALGMHRVEREEDLAEAMLDALSYDSAVIVEHWIEGTEVAVTVLGEGENAHVLPAVEIVPRGDSYDFDARMSEDGAEFFAPARLDETVAQRVSDEALRVHQLLGCRDISRVDMMIRGDGTVFVLECNTSPGMTETSLAPSAARAAGMPFEDIVTSVAKAALGRG